MRQFEFEVTVFTAHGVEDPVAMVAVRDKMIDEGLTLVSAITHDEECASFRVSVSVTDVYEAILAMFYARDAVYASIDECEVKFRRVKEMSERLIA